MPTSKGFSLIQLVIAAGILSVLSLAISRVFVQFASQHQRHDVKNVLRQKRMNVSNILRDERSWHKTLNYSQNKKHMRCILNSTNCKDALQNMTHEKGRLINVIVDASGRKVIDATAGRGFTRKGSHCEHFVHPDASTNSSSEQRDCVFRLEVRWKPLCDVNKDGRCINPSLRLSGTFIYSSQENKHPNLNLKPYNFHIIKSPFRSTKKPELKAQSQKLCQIMGGTIKNGTCTDLNKDFKKDIQRSAEEIKTQMNRVLDNMPQNVKERLKQRLPTSKEFDEH